MYPNVVTPLTVFFFFSSLSLSLSPSLNSLPSCPSLSLLFSPNNQTLTVKLRRICGFLTPHSSASVSISLFLLPHHCCVLDFGNETNKKKKTLICWNTNLLEDDTRPDWYALLSRTGWEEQLVWWQISPYNYIQLNRQHVSLWEFRKHTSLSPHKDAVMSCCYFSCQMTIWLWSSVLTEGAAREYLLDDQLCSFLKYSCT